MNEDKITDKPINDEIRPSQNSTNLTGIINDDVSPILSSFKQKTMFKLFPEFVCNLGN